MSRRRQAIKRIIKPDYLYDSRLVSKFINRVMFCGKKSIAEKIVYDSFEVVKDKKNIDPLVIFNKSIDNVKPIVEVRSRRIGGATYQVPIEVRFERSITLAMLWIVESARKRTDKGMFLKLANEIMDSSDETVFTGNSKGKGGAIKKREDMHRMAEANKAFAHYRW